MTDAIRGVTGTGPSEGVNPSTGPKTNQTTGAPTPAPVGAGADSADVSQTQSLLETINATVAAIPTIDQNRVASIRQSIMNGTYQIDSQQIAKQLLNSDQTLPGATSGSE